MMYAGITAEEFLLSYRRAKAEISHMTAELEAARVQLSGLKAIVYDDMPRTRDTERDLSAALVQYEKRARRLTQVIRWDLQRMKQVEDAIRTAPTRIQYQVLWLYYIDGLTMEGIAEQLDVSRQWITKQKKLGIENIFINWDEVKKNERQDYARKVDPD